MSARMDRPQHGAPVVAEMSMRDITAALGSSTVKYHAGWLSRNWVEKKLTVA